MNMALIKPRGNKTTEMRLRAALMREGLTGWVTHAKGIPGTPDIAFMAEKVAVFADGCFWHMCADHFRVPLSNAKYWLDKVRANRARDKRDGQRLSALGWRVFRLWEHDLADEQETKSLLRLIHRAIDTPYDPVTCMYLTREAHSVQNNLMWCGPCFGASTHVIKDLTGHGRYVEATCQKCGTVSVRLDGITIGKGGINGAGIE